MLSPSFNEHQIIAVIKSIDAGRPVKDACRVTDIAKATHY
ncbi:TPA: IS3 family transposase, partial [Salmonella enterica subsp. enterica serovar Birkenhead]